MVEASWCAASYNSWLLIEGSQEDAGVCRPASRMIRTTELGWEINNAGV